MVSTPALLFSATAAEDGASETIDTITMFGRHVDVAGVPESDHEIDSEEHEIINTADIMRAPRNVPGVHRQG